jgi:AcrR family transcriptional regulator
MTAQPTASSATGTRERIIATALELESRGSSAHLTLKTLAKALDLHYTALYYHFKSMDDLRAALVEHLATQRSEHLALARDIGTSAFDQLIAFIKLELHQPPTRLLTTVASHRIGGEPGHRARRAIRAHVDELAALIESGKGDGSIRPCDPATVSRMINHIMGRYANQHEQLFKQAHFDADFLTQTVVDFVANGIIAPGVDPALLGNGPAAPMRPLAGSPSSSFEKIVCTLSAHFNRQGYRGTSIPKVARSIGLSKTSFYKYAASKEELLYLCVQHSMRLVAESRQLARGDRQPTRGVIAPRVLRPVSQRQPSGPLPQRGTLRFLEQRTRRGRLGLQSGAPLGDDQPPGAMCSCRTNAGL